MSEFETYLQLLDHEFTIIGLAETWLNDSSCKSYGINGYKSVEKHRSWMGGGVTLFIRDNLTFSERNDLAHLMKILIQFTLKLARINCTPTEILS